MSKVRPIPISAGKHICDTYGYDQVVIMARKTGPDGVEHVTTYGVDLPNCDVAARMGSVLKYRIMGWNESKASPSERRSLEAAAQVST